MAQDGEHVDPELQIIGEAFEKGVASNWKQAGVVAKLRGAGSSAGAKLRGGLDAMTKLLGRAPDPRAPTPDQILRSAYAGDCSVGYAF